MVPFAWTCFKTLQSEVCMQDWAQMFYERIVVHPKLITTLFSFRMNYSPIGGVARVAQFHESIIRPKLPYYIFCLEVCQSRCNVKIMNVYGKHLGSILEYYPQNTVRFPIR
jgi:hypothetical protein